MATELQTVTSRDNRRLVWARRVRDGRETGLIFIEGVRLVREGLRSAIEIEQMFVDHAFDDTDLLTELLPRAAAASELPSSLFQTIADTDTPQGIIVIARRPADGPNPVVAALTAADVPLVVLLHEINNPSNLGAVLRTAEAAGVAGVIVTDGSADVYSPKSLRASMGAAFRLPVWSGVRFDEAVSWAEDNELMVTGTAASAPAAYTSIDWQVPRLLIFGSEAHGLTSEQLAASEQTICIPMSSSVESLNLAVSAGVTLFEARRQVQEGRDA